MLRHAYAKYLRQIGSAFSQAYVEQSATGEPRLAGLLVQLFEARFAPAVSNRDDAVAAASSALEKALDDVTGLDQDRILGVLLSLVQATLRTNHYKTDDGVPKPYLSLNSDSPLSPGLPAPRPLAIWVCSRSRASICVSAGWRQTDARSQWWSRGQELHHGAWVGSSPRAAPTVRWPTSS